jgi:aspartyl/asparaginyl beta-hydroxylase (cupin superfamily)
VREMNPHGMATRFFMSIVAAAERLNLRCAKLGNPCIYDNADFPWVAPVEAEWRRIRCELDRVMVRSRELPNIQDITKDAVSITHDSGWKIFVLTAYGIESPPNIALCPETWRIVSKIPGLKTAMFSVFEPGKRLPPHRGPYNGVLRLHLGLIVPEPRERLGIRVGSEPCEWEEGRVLVFDDSYEHEAWNETGSPRVVLFVDFVKPLRFPANVLNGLLLRLAVFTPYLREGAESLREWEQRFYSGDGQAAAKRQQGWSPWRGWARRRKA